MKSTIREIINHRDFDALTQLLRDWFDLSLSDAQVRFIIEQATRAGGPTDDPWTESTWRMWLKVQATHGPPEPQQTPTPPQRDLEAVLMESSTVLLTTTIFTVCYIRDWNELFAEFEEDSWAELFPISESITPSLVAGFDQRGGREWLGGAPFASWLYARLEFLGMAIVDEENDLGGYLANLLMTADGRPVGVLSLDAVSDEVHVWVEARAAEVADSIRKQFIDLLLQDIRDIARCELRVHGAEVGYTNSYGWTGQYFLGADNVSG